MTVTMESTSGIVLTSAGTSTTRVQFARPAVTTTGGHLDLFAGQAASTLATDTAALAETFEILRDHDLMRAIEEGDEAVAAGDIVSLEEFRRLAAEQRARQR